MRVMDSIKGEGENEKEKQLLLPSPTLGEGVGVRVLDDLDEFDDLPSEEREATEEEVVDQASAARTIAELQAEIALLEELEQLALRVRRSGTDKN